MERREGFRTDLFSRVLWHHPSLHRRRLSEWEVLRVESCTSILGSRQLPMPLCDWGQVLSDASSLTPYLTFPPLSVPHFSVRVVSMEDQTPGSGRMRVCGNRPEQSEAVLLFYFSLGAVPREGPGYSFLPGPHPWLWQTPLGGGSSSNSSSTIYFLMHSHPM